MESSSKAPFLANISIAPSSYSPSFLNDCSNLPTSLPPPPLPPPPLARPPPRLSQNLPLSRKWPFPLTRPLWLIIIRGSSVGHICRVIPNRTRCRRTRSFFRQFAWMDLSIWPEISPKMWRNWLKTYNGCTKKKICSKLLLDFLSLVSSRVLLWLVRPSVVRSVRPSHLNHFYFLLFLLPLDSQLLPKGYSDHEYSPCPHARDWGSGVSGHVFYWP